MARPIAPYRYWRHQVLYLLISVVPRGSSVSLIACSIHIARAIGRNGPMSLHRNCAAGLRSPYFFSTTPTMGPIGRKRSWREIEGAYSAEIEPSRKRASGQCIRSRNRIANWWKVTG